MWKFCFLSNNPALSSNVFCSADQTGNLWFKESATDELRDSVPCALYIAGNKSGVLSDVAYWQNQYGCIQGQDVLLRCIANIWALIPNMNEVEWKGGGQKVCVLHSACHWRNWGSKVVRFIQRWDGSICYLCFFFFFKGLVSVTNLIIR